MSNQFLVRLTNARSQARALMGEPHVSNDIVVVITELLNATVELERQLGSAEGQSGDLRVLKSRMENLNQELKKKDADLQSFKKKFLDIVIAEIRNISGEVAKITAATQDDPEGVAQKSAKAIGQSLRTLAESLTKT